MLKVAVSSTCFKERKLEKLLDYAVIAGFTDIELSGNISYTPSLLLKKTLKRYDGKINFYVHNYFPTPSKSFVLNMGHPDTIYRSICHCKKAIELCSHFDIKYYSIHAGTAFNPSPDALGKLQIHISSINFTESRKMLIDGFLLLAEYAENKGITFLIENNVVSEFNSPDGGNERYHFADIYESQLLYPLFEHPNIAILLDIGHLKVSAHTTKFEPEAFIKLYMNKIKAVHLSENDRKSDQNLPVSEDSWFWSCIPWYQLEYVSLELLNNNSVEMLHSQIDLVRNKISKLMQS